MDPYSDTARYEAATRFYRTDIPFYRALAKEAGGTVVDLCCGSGRLTLPASEVSPRVIGVDKSTEMLAVARTRGAARIEWVEADARSFELGEKADLIFCGFNSFQDFVDEASQQAVLERVRSHLPVGGRFALDVPNPTEGFLRRYEASPFRNLKGWAKRRMGPWIPGGLGHQVARYDRRRSVVKMDWFRFAGEPLHTRIRCRWFSPPELEELLRRAGFRMEARYGGFQGETFQPSSPTQVVVCRLARLSHQISSQKYGLAP